MGSTLVAVFVFLGILFASAQHVVYNFGGCTVNNEMVHECDGTSRPLTEAEKQDIRQWNVDFQEHMRKQFPPGFPFVQPEPSDPPQMKWPCKTCDNSAATNNYNLNSGPFNRAYRHVQ